MNRKGFSNIGLIVILIIVLAGAASYFVLTQQGAPSAGKSQAINTTDKALTQPSTQDEISNWKIYRNKENGYEFKYPGTWLEGDSYPYGNDTDLIYESDEICDEPSSDDPDKYWAGLRCNTPAKIYVAAFSKSIFIEPEDKVPSSFDEYSKLVVKHDERLPGYVLTAVKSFDVLNHRGARLTGYKEDATYKKEQIMIELSHDIVLNIELSYLPRYENHVLPVFDDIISTLKFTK